MKKTLTLIITALLLVSLCFTLAACGEADDATTLDWTTMPKASFTVGEDIGDFALSYTKDGQTVVISYSDYAEFITLSGFSTEEEGTFDASVSYEGKSVTFTYTVQAPVVESDFESGAGTTTNPFIIKTAEQFLKLNDNETAGVYYALGADIDLTDVAEDYIITKTFSGILSGANTYKLILSGDCESFIFKLIENATFNDLTLSFNGNNWKAMVYTASLDNLFYNVDTIGKVVCNDSNYAPYLCYNWKYTDVTCGSARTTLKDCDNGLDIISMSYIGGFVSFPGHRQYNTNGNNSTALTFDNCTNTGTLIGTKVGMLFSNSSTTYMYNVTAKNCTNNGVIRATDWAHLVFGAGNGPLGGVDYTADGELVKENVVNGANGVCELYTPFTTEPQGSGYINVSNLPAATDKVGFIIGFYTTRVAGGTYYVQGIEMVDVVGGEATSSKVGRFKIQGYNADVVAEKGYTTIEALTEWETNIIEDVPTYVYENNSDYTLPNAVAYNKSYIYAFAFDADGNIIAGAKVQ